MVIQRLKAYLHQPYPYNGDPRNYLRIMLIFTLFVGIFLSVFQPFGISSLPGAEPYLTAMAFAGVTFAAGLFMLVVTLFFQDHFSEDNWTVGRELFWGLMNFLAVGHGNYLLIRSHWLEDYDLMSYTQMIGGTFAVGFFPYAFMMATQHLRLLKINTKEAGRLTHELIKDHETTAPEKRHVKLVGENEGDELNVNVADLLYIQSTGNYIEVVCEKNKHIQKTLLRSSLSNAEARFQAFDHIYRCHRTYLVNLEHVNEISGNSQGYRLHLHPDIDPIPVARTKNTEFKELISGYRTASEV